MLFHFKFKNTKLDKNKCTELTEAVFIFTFLQPNFFKTRMHRNIGRHMQHTQKIKLKKKFINIFDHSSDQIIFAHTKRDNLRVRLISKRKF